MGGAPPTEASRLLSELFDNDLFVAAIEHAYRTRDSAPLDELVKTLVASYAWGRSADVIDTARNDSMLAIALKMNESIPANRVAPQVPTIIRNKLIDADKAEQRHRDRRDPGLVESTLVGLPARDDVEKTVELRERLREAFALLERLKTSNELYFDAVLADLNSTSFDDVISTMTAKHGTMTRDTVSTLLSRGHKKLRAMCDEANHEQA